MALVLDLQGKKGLIVGICNDRSIAYGCARILREAGAEIAVTHADEKTANYSHPLAEKLQASLFLPCDVQSDAQMEQVFAEIRHHWGKLDFLLHSVAFAPGADLHGRVADCSRAGFIQTMDISCYSFIRMAHLAEPLMREGGSLMTVSYLGSEEVVNHYGIMGPAKAALESVTRYLAAELGEKNIRVNALSPGPIRTRAALGIEGFEEILHASEQKAPLRRNIDLNDIGYMAAFLASDWSKNITGGVHYVDAGYEVMD